MALLIDPPDWTAYGHSWSHLVSDHSVEELHAFAVTLGLHPRLFEGDHYDVPESRYADAVSAGAVPTASRDLLRALQSSGLRMPKRPGEKGIVRVHDVSFPNGTTSDIDLIASDRMAPEGRVFGAMVFLRDAHGSLVAVHSVRRRQWGSPGGWREGSEPVRANAVREVREETGLLLAESDLRPCGYERYHNTRVREGGAVMRPEGRDVLQAFTATVPEVRPTLSSDLDDTSERRWVTPAEYAALCRNEFWWPLAARVLGFGW